MLFTLSLQITHNKPPLKTSDQINVYVKFGDIKLSSASKPEDDVVNEIIIEINIPKSDWVK